MNDEDLTEFLNNYQIFKNKPTFLEIARFPRWENVWSNILRFFLRNDHHGMNGFLIKCICKTLGSLPEAQKQSRTCKRLYEAEELGKVLSVRREVKTPGKGRIDIFVETENYFFFIENKVDAILKNNLDDYFVHTVNKTKNNKKYFGIVLGKSIINIKELKVDVYKDYLYIMTYKNLLESIEKDINEVLYSADNKYLTFFIDFIETVKRVMEGKMNIDFYKYYLEGDNETKINNIFDNVRSLRIHRKDERDKYAKELNKRFSNYGIKMSTPSNNKSICLKMDGVLEVDIIIGLKSADMIIKNNVAIEKFVGNDEIKKKNDDYCYSKAQPFLNNNIEKFMGKCYEIINTIIEGYQKPESNQ
jgi:hypothetical protein